MFKLGLNLLIISAVAALLLALTNSVTASTIAQRNEQANAEARKLVLESAQDFEEVKDVKTGNTAFIATTVGRVSAGNQIARTDKGLVECNDCTQFVYQRQEKISGGERTTSYGFYQKQTKDVVYAIVSQTIASTTGRMFTSEFYYKGKQMGWYLFFDEVVDMDGVVQNKLETPTVVFANGTQGVIIDGITYKKTSNEF